MENIEQPSIPPAQRIYCNRTLNLRTIKAIGFDMDYTLVHYHAKEWENMAYAQLKQRLKEQGLPVSGLSFEPEFVIPGLIVDLELGNIVKANRFGYIKRAYHGTKPLSFEDTREHYVRNLVVLSEPRWVFLNTLFSLSKACMYSQLVERLDQGDIKEPMGYAGLYQRVEMGMNESHTEGTLKEQIKSDPDRYVDLDPDLPQALNDLRDAGKKLLLITNSEWHYTQAMMAWICDRYLKKHQSWRDLFNLVIVSARKPSFFAGDATLFRIINEAGDCRPHMGPLEEPGIYLGGNAGLLEKHYGYRGDQFLYMGDHIFADVSVSKSLLRWRTGLVIRDLEDEIKALEEFATQQAELSKLMDQKEKLEQQHCRLRLDIQRRSGPLKQHKKNVHQIQDALTKLDQHIAPLAKAAAGLYNPHWGLLLRTGTDKSSLARQVERYADIYTSRVSNLGLYTPFAFLRSTPGTLPHDPTLI